MPATKAATEGAVSSGLAHLLCARDAVGLVLDAEGQGDEEAPATHKRACGAAVVMRWDFAQHALAAMSFLLQHRGASGTVHNLPLSSEYSRTLQGTRSPMMAVTRPTGPATAAFLVSSAMWADES